MDNASRQFLIYVLLVTEYLPGEIDVCQTTGIAEKMNFNNSQALLVLLVLREP
jgi:hypothetical protein